MNPYLHCDSIFTADPGNAFDGCEYAVTGLQQLTATGGFAMTEVGYSVANDTYILLGLLLMLGLVAISTYHFRGLTVLLLKSTFSTKRNFSLPGSGRIELIAYHLFLLISASALSVAVTGFDMLARQYQFSTVLGIPYWLIALFYTLVMVFIYAKASLYAVVNWVFFDKETSRRWMTAYILITALTALFVFPVSMLGLCGTISQEIVTYSYLFAAFLYESLLIFKLFVNFRAKKYGILLIFLYFCSVELLPALTIWHLISRNCNMFIEANVLY